MVSDDEEKVSKAVRAPTIEGEVPCVSPPVYEEDNDNNDDDDDNNDDADKEDDNDDNKEDNDDDNEEDICDFDLNDVKDMSEYEVLRLQRIHRNNVKLASLGLLGGITPATFPSADRTNRKKRMASQGDFVRRVQPNRNAFKPTSYKDLGDPFISKRTRSIYSSDRGEEDTVSKRMDEAE